MLDKPGENGGKLGVEGAGVNTLGANAVPGRRTAHAPRSRHYAVSPIARSSGVIGDWRDVWLSVTLAAHELEGVLTLIRRQLP